MARFRFYSVHIKTLSSYDRKTKVHNWERLFSFARSTELVPNLIDFYCSPIDLHAVSTFLSRSTRRMVAHDRHHSWDSSKLLEKIAHTCPSIYSLEFWPQPREVTDAPGLMQDFAFLPNIHGLRSLTSNSLIIESPVIELVARLPNLCRLASCSNWSLGARWSPSLNDRLPEDSFPVLDDLGTSLNTSHDVMRFWKTIPLGKLKRLRLEMESTTNVDYSLFVPILCSMGPQISSLGLIFPQCSEPQEEDEAPYRIGIQTFEHLARLPLDVHFSLDYTVLDFENAWVEVASAWQSLKTIDCLYQPTSLDDLLHLSSALPALESLTCDFDLEEEALNIERNWMTTRQPPFFPGLKLLCTKRSKLKDLMLRRWSKLGDLARAIAYYWPNLKVQNFREEYLSVPGYDDEDVDPRMEDFMDKLALFNMFRELISANVRFFHQS